MKKLIITEDEKRRILGLHKSLLREDTANPIGQPYLDATQKLEVIQKACELNPDVIIGPQTTNAIVNKLKKGEGKPSETTYDCVTSNVYMTKVEMGGNMKPEYEYGDLRFKLDGTYVDSKEPSVKYTYTCSVDSEGKFTIISTLGHGDISKDQHWGKVKKTTKFSATPLEPIKQSSTYEPTFETIPYNPESREDLLTRQKQEKEDLAQRERTAKELRKTAKKELRQLPKDERNALKRELGK